MAFVSVATENFNRAGPALGANWANLDNVGSGDVVIDSSTRGTGTGGAGGVNRVPCARWVGAGSFTNDQYSQVTLVNGSAVVDSQTWAGVIVRASADTGAGRDMYMAYKVLSGISNFIVLARVVNGTFTSLYSATHSAADGDVLGLGVEGTTLTVYLNGTALGGGWTATDASLSSGAPGVLCCNLAFVDTWEGGNITSGGGGPLLGGPVRPRLTEGRLVA